MEQEYEELEQPAPRHECACGRHFKNAGALVTHKKHCAHIRQGDQLVQDFFAEVATDPPAASSAPIVTNGAADFATVTTQVFVRKLPNYGNLPNLTRATPGSAGYDLHAAIEQRRCIGVGERLPIPTGISVEIPPSLVIQVVPRSGLALKQGITVLNTPGTIDSDYRGELTVILINHSSTKFWVEPAMRIAQMLFVPVVTPDVVYVDALSPTSRGTGGFGSSGSF
jgi:dUTP pyrophosphatase